MEHTISEPGPDKEFYHYSFKSLCLLVGTDRALQLVEQYQKLSKQFSGTPGWFLHNCKLLTTYNHPETDETIPLLERQCSVFYKPISNLTKQKVLTINQVANMIREPTFATETNCLRSIPDKKTNSTYKRNAFCYTTFSGTFSERYDEKLLQHSGLICIDLDNLNERLLEIRTLVNSDPDTVLSFISPNGDGLKVLFEMVPGVYTQEQYYQACTHHLVKLCDLPPGKIDATGKNVSRACFLPHDPEIFINPNLLPAC